LKWESEGYHWLSERTLSSGNVNESLEENEVEAGLVGVVVVDDVAGDDLIQLRDVRHFSIGPLFLQQVGHGVIAKKQIVQTLRQNLDGNSIRFNPSAHCD